MLQIYRCDACGCYPCMVMLTGNEAEPTGCLYPEQDQVFKWTEWVNL